MKERYKVCGLRCKAKVALSCYLDGLHAANKLVGDRPRTYETFSTTDEVF